MPPLINYVRNGFNFMLVNVDIEDYAENYANELCNREGPPNAVDVARKGKKMSHGQKSNELTSN